jgi:hypothetical protein
MSFELIEWLEDAYKTGTLCGTFKIFLNNGYDIDVRISEAKDEPGEIKFLYEKQKKKGAK